MARVFETLRVGDTDAFDDLIVEDYGEHVAQAAHGLQAAKDYFAPVGPVDVEVHRMITEGDLVAVHSNYNTGNSPTRSHAQSLAQSTIDGHSQAEPHANLERLLAAQGESGGGWPGTGIPPARSPPDRSFSIFSASQRDRSPSRPSSFGESRECSVDDDAGIALG